MLYIHNISSTLPFRYIGVKLSPSCLVLVDLQVRTLVPINTIFVGWLFPGLGCSMLKPYIVDICLQLSRLAHRTTAGLDKNCVWRVGTVGAMGGRGWVYGGTGVQ